MMIENIKTFIAQQLLLNSNQLILNIAGTRESKAKGIQQVTKDLLVEAIKSLL